MSPGRSRGGSSGLAFAIVAMEGPDEYSQAGGLGVRVTHLGEALSALGHPTDLFFAGDPQLPAEERRGRLQLHRMAQDVSRRYPKGVYDGEEAKMTHLGAVLPGQLVRGWALPLIENGITPVLLFEEWHTAAWVRRVSDLLWQAGTRDRAVLVWNANNQFGFEAIDWPALAYTASVTTISRYMRALLQQRGLDAPVIPNGIPVSALRPPPAADVRELQAAAGGASILLKIGRFHPDKRWEQAIAAVHQLRSSGRPVRMLARGGREEYGRELLARAAASGLFVHSWRQPITGVADLARALAESAGADILELATFLPEGLIPTMYAAALAVLANSGFEPFGLVGLETMAAGGVAVVGSTGEDYARHLHNSLVAQTDDPRELAFLIGHLLDRPQLVAALRRSGRSTARTYTWPEVVRGDLVPTLPQLARRQLTRWPADL